MHPIFGSNTENHLIKWKCIIFLFYFSSFEMEKKRKKKRKEYSIVGTIIPIVRYQTDKRKPNNFKALEPSNAHCTSYIVHYFEKKKNIKKKRSSIANRQLLPELKQWSFLQKDSYVRVFVCYILLAFRHEITYPVPCWSFQTKLQGKAKQNRNKTKQNRIMKMWTLCTVHFAHDSYARSSHTIIPLSCDRIISR